MLTENCKPFPSFESSKKMEGHRIEYRFELQKEWKPKEWKPSGAKYIKIDILILVTSNIKCEIEHSNKAFHVALFFSGSWL